MSDAAANVALQKAQKKILSEVAGVFGEFSSKEDSLASLILCYVLEFRTECSCRPCMETLCGVVLELELE